MKYISILFSTAMVQALVDNTKSQTRRICKIQTDDRGYIYSRDERIENWHGQFMKPYTSVGDILWVREEHKVWWEKKPEQVCETWFCEFKDGSTISLYGKEIPLRVLKNLRRRKTLGKWQRARFLPKVFSRIFLKVKAARIERLHIISETDAIAEGVMVERSLPFNQYLNYHKYIYQIETAKESYQTLWEEINGPESWNANPWVWVIEFERTEKPENFMIG